MTDIAVIILQKDEMLHIGRCLEKLKPLEAKQTFVVDCFSTDGSDRLAEELGATVVKHEWPGNQAEQFQWALENLPIETEWILRLDADEYLTPMSITWLKEALAKVGPEVNALEFTLERKFLGSEIHHATNSIEMVRMIRRGHGRYSDALMDERIVFDGEKRAVPVVFFDDNLHGLAWWRQKHRGYAKREAEQAILGRTQDPRKRVYYRVPRYIRPVVYFFVRYFAQLGFLDGVAGLKWNFWQGLWYRWIVDVEIGKLKRYSQGLGGEDALRHQCSAKGSAESQSLCAENGRSTSILRPFTFCDATEPNCKMAARQNRVAAAISAAAPQCAESPLASKSCASETGSSTSKRPIRILHVLSSLRVVDGGPATSVPQTAMAQMEAGMEVGIAYFDARDLTDAAQEAFAKGVKAHPFRGSHRRLNRIKFSFDMLFRFKRVARDYDVIVTHLNWIFATWWAAHIARKLGKPYIMMPRGCISPNAMANGSWKKWLVGPLDRFALRRAAAVWTTSPMEAKWAKKYVPEAKVDIMPMGLDTSLYSASRVKAPGEKILLFMSRISAIKALDMLAEAWKEVWTPGWKLVMVGPDDRGHLAKMKRLYEQECSEGSYAFRAALYGEAKAKMLREASAFILPSRSENWSVSISEAMASALPVICTMGAPWGIIPEIGAGWRTEISAQGLKRALGEMMEKSDQELYEMGVRGMRWVKENLDWRKVGEEMRERVERLVEGE